MISYRIPRYISSDFENVDLSDCFETSDRGAPYVIHNIENPSKLRPSSSDWRELNSDEYSCNVDERVVNFQLEPQMAVRIHGEVNYLGHERESEGALALGRVHGLGIAPLILQGGQGSIVYEGDQVIKAFEKRSNMIYILEYK